MGGSRKLALSLLLIVMAALSGCGSGADDGTQAKDTPSAAGSREEGARSFLGPGETVLYGHEAVPAERRQASRVVEAWMRARSTANWTRDCKFFSRQFRQGLVVDAHAVSHGKVQNCPQALAYFGPEASGDLVNTMTGPIDSLRVERGQGYALYHGRGGVDWTVSMNKEAGKWKVSVSTPVKRSS